MAYKLDERDGVIYLLYDTGEPSGFKWETSQRDQAERKLAAMNSKPADTLTTAEKAFMTKVKTKGNPVDDETKGLSVGREHTATEIIERATHVQRIASDPDLQAIIDTYTRIREEYGRQAVRKLAQRIADYENELVNAVLPI